jgi:hypothetical protein
MRRPGPTYYYWGGGRDEWATIAEIYYDVPDDSKPVAAIQLIGTTDPEQAERWRSLLAAGKTPNLSADPPILEFDEELMDQLARELRS